MKKIGFWTLIFLLFSGGLSLLKSNTEIVEKHYSQGFYYYYSKTLNFCTAYIPFSIGDIFYIIVGIYLLLKLTKTIRQSPLLKDKIIACTGFTIKAYTLFFILFNLTWGLNNYRTSLQDKLAIGLSYDTTDLIALTTKLSKLVNIQQYQLTNNTAQAVVNRQSLDQIFKKAQQGIETTAIQLNLYRYFPTSINSSLYSTPLTYAGFGGYINPFTIEAQVNNQIPNLTMIITASHEISHQMGYARESDANFIGYLATYNQKELIDQYAANIYALRFCLSELYRTDSAKADQIVASLYPGVRINIYENTVFWNKHKTIIDRAFKHIYGAFLKTNNQKEGIRSYNKFLALLINYNKKVSIYS
ncbi:DUF3810 domain-containing protein [Myroides pelagicus]|uniref:DUF3810 domain-containing protein n=1 Tax=Myroides pelagicus TaxID=270914 RepID=UPI002DB6DB3F|nr:DUF3810 domain-containing protein [Myroides pelagicus]MEC4113918.1 DUF3810 domain-containing protein [Myroides pelagicus]